MDLAYGTAAGHTPFEAALIAGQTDVVCYFMDKIKYPADYKDQKGNTLLHLAYQSPNGELIRCLSERYHVTETFNAEGDLPLHTACKASNLKLLRENKNTLLHDKVNQHGETARETACRLGKLEVVQFFLEETKYSPQGGRATFLHLACEGGHLPLVKYLVETKKSALVETVNGETSMERAAFMGHLDIVKYFFEKNPFNVITLNNVISSACKGGQLQIIQYLLVEKKLKTLSVSQELNPLHVACMAGKKDIVRFLITNKFYDPNSTIIDGKNALHTACEHNQLEVIKYLVKHTKPDLNSMTQKGATPLHLACIHGHLEVVRFLLGQKLSTINSQDTDGFTPLHLAAKSPLPNSQEITKLLLEAGADHNLKEYRTQKTAIAMASEAGNIEVVTCLLKKGAYPSISPSILLKDRDLDKTVVEAVKMQGDPTLAQLIFPFIKINPAHFQLVPKIDIPIQDTTGFNFEKEFLTLFDSLKLTVDKEKIREKLISFVKSLDEKCLSSLNMFDHDKEVL